VKQIELGKLRKGWASFGNKLSLFKKESETNEKKLTQVKSHLEKQKGILGMIPKKELLELVQ